MRPSSLFVGLALFVGAALGELPAIEAKGSKLFFSNNGTQLCVTALSIYQSRLTNRQLHPWYCVSAYVLAF